jgi:hypothetical protein
MSERETEREAERERERERGETERGTDLCNLFEFLVFVDAEDAPMMS